jgi:galactokinase
VVVPSPETKALRCQKAEHDFCNMPCGIMDQFISALGHEGHLLEVKSRRSQSHPQTAYSTLVLRRIFFELGRLFSSIFFSFGWSFSGQIDCRSNVGTKVAMAAGDAVILVTNSNVKHQLTGSEYPSRVAQCKQATAAIAATFPEVSQLRDATLDMLEAAKKDMDEVTYRRARHVIGENARVGATAAALQAGDFATVGHLMVQSHNSLRDDFEVRLESCAV